MKPEYWLERWQEGRIGFHRAGVNPALVAHHERVLGQCVKLLVPLCGKSVDLEWLVVQGHEVWGIELSELAAQAFFAERGMNPERHEADGLLQLRHGSVTIVVGDFFAVTPDAIGFFDGAYDRAALIALPPEMRQKYVAHLRTLLAPKSKVLLLTLDFDAEGGPPFSVGSPEVESAYGAQNVTLLETTDARADAPGPVERGASFVRENVYAIRVDG
ncbi:MAG TPA: thiopurine S-methyltransferase [Polyangiaceae bacterium]|nr:thiopurine S-methyltransferase [Polyangiaceae bacterium]